MPGTPPKTALSPPVALLKSRFRILNPVSETRSYPKTMFDRFWSAAAACAACSRFLAHGLASAHKKHSAAAP